MLTGSPECLGGEILRSGVNWVSGAHSPANQPYFVPVRMVRPFTLYAFGWVNGSTLGANVDAGLYQLAGTAGTLEQIRSTGSVAQAGTSTWQEATTAPLELDPGLYYIGWVMSATGHMMRNAVAGMIARACGMVTHSATALPLPATVTMTAGSQSVPTVGFRIQP